MNKIATIIAGLMLLTGVAMAQGQNTECVELLEDWAGNSAGVQVMVNPAAAQNLVELGRGVYCTLAIEFAEGPVNTEVPVVYSLSGAYPNPFNPSTSFELTLAKEQNVRVEVYNILGHQVDSRDLGTLSAETQYTIRFEAENLASGLYVVRFVGENFVGSKSVNLLK